MNDTKLARFSRRFRSLRLAILTLAITTILAGLLALNVTLFHVGFVLLGIVFIMYIGFTDVLTEKQPTDLF